MTVSSARRKNALSVATGTLSLQSSAQGRGQNPILLDSKEPTGDHKAFPDERKPLHDHAQEKDPEQNDAVFANAKQDSVDRYESYRRNAAETLSRQNNRTANMLIIKGRTKGRAFWLIPKGRAFLLIPKGRDFFNPNRFAMMGRLDTRHHAIDESANCSCPILGSDISLPIVPTLWPLVKVYHICS
jgi:hypothetical protein